MNRRSSSKCTHLFVPLPISASVWSFDKSWAAVKSGFNRDTVSHLKQVCWFFCCSVTLFQFFIVIICFCWYFIFVNIITKACQQNTNAKEITFCIMFKGKVKASNMIIFCWFDEKWNGLHFRRGNESIDFESMKRCCYREWITVLPFS